MAILNLDLADLRRRTSMKWRTFPADVLPLWVAEMDVAMHPAVRDAVVAAADLGDTGYPWGRGYEDAYRRMARSRWRWDIEEPQITLSGDVMNAIQAVLEQCTRPGDPVVINPPVYPPFRTVVAGYGRQVVEVPLTSAGRLDPEGLERAFSTPNPPTAYLLCSPHNPNGTVHTAEELTAVAELTRRHGIALIVDEIHAVLVDPGVEFVPLLTLPAASGAVSVTSAGKAWNLAAFKAGLIIAGPELDGLFQRLPPLATHSGGHFGVIAHSAALTHAQDWADELRAEISSNKVLLQSLLAELVPAVRYTPAEGTYLAWVDCSALGVPNPAALFLDKGRVAFNAGANFGREHADWVRINLATSPSIITEAVERMAAALALNP